MQPAIKDIFITLESLLKSSRKVCAATVKICAATFEHIFYVCRCFWEYFMFYKERAATSKLCPLKDTINHLQLFVEKRQFFSQNNKWLNNIIYH